MKIAEDAEFSYRFFCPCPQANIGGPVSTSGERYDGAGKEKRHEYPGFRQTGARYGVDIRSRRDGTPSCWLGRPSSSAPTTSTPSRRPFASGKPRGGRSRTCRAGRARSRTAVLKKCWPWAPTMPSWSRTPGGEAYDGLRMARIVARAVGTRPRRVDLLLFGERRWAGQRSTVLRPWSRIFSAFPRPTPSSSSRSRVRAGRTPVR